MNNIVRSGAGDGSKRTRSKVQPPKPAKARKAEKRDAMPGRGSIGRPLSGPKSSRRSSTTVVSSSKSSEKRSVLMELDKTDPVLAMYLKEAVIQGTPILKEAIKRGQSMLIALESLDLDEAQFRAKFDVLDKPEFTALKPNEQEQYAANVSRILLRIIQFIETQEGLQRDESVEDGVKLSEENQRILKQKTKALYDTAKELSKKWGAKALELRMQMMQVSGTTSTDSTIVRSAPTTLALKPATPGVEEIGFCCNALQTLKKLRANTSSFYAVLLTLVKARTKGIL